jgi:hypothetical protein
MKKLNIFSVAILALILSACENHLDASQVPPAVKESFQKKYPNATEVEWIEEGSSLKVIYEAEFKLEGKEITAEFSEAGEFLEQE